MVVTRTQTTPEGECAVLRAAHGYRKGDVILLLDFLADHLEFDYTISQLSAYANLSRPTLYRLVERLTKGRTLRPHADDRPIALLSDQTGKPRRPLTGSIRLREGEGSGRSHVRVLAEDFERFVAALAAVPFFALLTKRDSPVKWWRYKHERRLRLTQLIRLESVLHRLQHTEVLLCARADGCSLLM